MSTVCQSPLFGSKNQVDENLCQKVNLDLRVKIDFPSGKKYQLFEFLHLKFNENLTFLPPNI